MDKKIILILFVHFIGAIVGLVPRQGFYVPGELIAGPDLSRMYPSEIFSSDISVTYRQSEVLNTTENPVPPPSIETPKHQCSGEKFLECSGCNKYAICPGPGEALNEINCDVDKPYCNSGIEGDYCSRNPSNLCEGQATSTFMCTSTGYFPDLSNCRMYHICARDRNKKLLASDYICPQGYYFSAETKACRRQFLARECTKRELKCKDIETPEPIKYDVSPQYYYYCTPEKSDLVIFRCPDNSEYRAFDYSCKYRCRRSGNFPHSDNQNRYFICFYQSRRLTSRIEDCPNGFVFSKEHSACVQDSDEN